MQTDDWRAIEADPEYQRAKPSVKRAIAAVHKKEVEWRGVAPTAPRPAPPPDTRSKPPLVLKSQQDKPKKKPERKAKPVIAPRHATLAEEVGAFLPEYPGADPDRQWRENRLANPPAPNVMNRLIRSARETIPAAAQEGVSSGMIAGVHQQNLDRAKPPTRQPIPTGKPVAPEAEIGFVEKYTNAASDVWNEKSRLWPTSPGWAEGAGAYAPTFAAGLVDPAGAYLGGAALKAAAPVVKGAAKIAGKAAQKVADLPIPTNALLNAQRLITEEGGQYYPGVGAAAARRGLDAADNAFETAGQTIGSAAKQVGTAGKAVLNAGAARVAPTATRVGDVLNIPKAKAEEAATAIANKIDLKGRTGKTADEWYQTAKSEPAATSSPVLNSLLDTRRYLVSDFGMTPEMKAIREAGRVAKGNYKRPLEELALRLNKERTGDEQFDLHWLATEAAPPPGPMDARRAHLVSEAARVKEASSQADKMLVDANALTPEIAAQYDGTHLPRGYAKWWLAEGKAAEALRHPINTITDNKIGGWYQRGTKARLTPDEFANGIADGKPWREVSRNSDGTINAARDYTIEERQGWGEVRNVSSALQRKANKGGRDIESATILNEYAKPGAGDARGAFAIPAEPDSVAPKGYVLLDATTAKESGIPKYGRLANHYVRDDVAFYLRNENELKPIINKINTVTMNNLWKKMVTIGNFPGYFVNNFFQNPLVLERTGGTMADMPAAWAKMASNDMDIQQLESMGVIRNGVLARELGSQLQHFNATLSTQHMHDGFSIPKNIFRAMNALKAYENNAYKLAGASDDLYRVALVEGLVNREGKTLEEAAEIAKKAFYDSDAVNAPAAQVASTFAPFAKVLWWAANNEAEAWTKNPGKTAYMNFLMSALPVAASYAMGKSGAQQDAEHLAMAPNMQGHGNNFPLPYTDSEGQSYYGDASNWNHYNQFKPVDNTALSVKLPFSVPILGDKVGYPRGLAPGGPVAITGQLITGKDWFTGKDIVERDGDGDVKKEGRGGFAWRNLTPGILRNGASLYDTITGDEEYSNGVTTSLPAKVLRNLTGTKARPVNIEKGIKWNSSRRDKDDRDLSYQIKDENAKASAALENGNQKKADKHATRAAELEKQRDKVIRNADDRNERMSKGLPQSESTPEPKRSNADITAEMDREATLAQEAEDSGDTDAFKKHIANIARLMKQQREQSTNALTK